VLRLFDYAAACGRRHAAGTSDLDLCPNLRIATRTHGEPWTKRSLSRYMTAPITSGPIALAMSVSPQPVAPEGGASIEEPSTSHTPTR
jgi:hypothetical protein